MFPTMLHVHLVKQSINHGVPSNPLSPPIDQVERFSKQVEKEKEPVFTEPLINAKCFICTILFIVPLKLLNYFPTFTEQNTNSGKFEVLPNVT